MARVSIPTSYPGWEFFYHLPSLPSSRPPSSHHADTSGHARGFATPGSKGPIRWTAPAPACAMTDNTMLDS
jgi:hypothetical protein